MGCPEACVVVDFPGCGIPNPGRLEGGDGGGKPATGGSDHGGEEPRPEGGDGGGAGLPFFLCCHQFFMPSNIASDSEEIPYSSWLS